jgi:hypothetical protein
MTIEQLEQRIQMHREELAILQSSHDQMVARFQEQAGKNQSRFAQLHGAIAELMELIQNEQSNYSSGSGGTGALANGLPDAVHRTH